MQFSPTAVGSEGTGPSEAFLNSLEYQRILAERLSFVQALNTKGVDSLLGILSPGHTEQNTLIRLTAILISNPGNGPFAELQLHRIGCILEVLAERIDHPQPANLFLRFDVLKQIEMVSQYRTLPAHQRLLAVSIIGLYPLITLSPDSRLPLFVPYVGDEKCKRAGNRNWLLTRNLLETQFYSKNVQELRTKDPATFLSFEILMGRISEEFGHLGWMQSLWRSLFHYYHKKCMNILIEASRSQGLDTDSPEGDLVLPPLTTEAPLELNWESINSMDNVSEFDLLSIRMVKALIENSMSELEIFQSELLRFSNREQYQDDMLKIMSLLFKYTQSDRIKNRLIQMAEKANMEQAYLPLLSNPDEIVRYFESRSSINPKRIRHFPEELRNRLAESSWKRNPTAIMELEESFASTSMQVHVIEALHSLPLTQLARALDYIQKPQNMSGYQRTVGSQFPLFKHLIKEWESLQRFMGTFPFTLDSAKQIHAILKSQHQILSCNKFSLKPPRFHQGWLLEMLEQIFICASTHNYSAEALQLSKEALLSATHYLRTVVQESLIVAKVYPRMAEMMCRDPSLIEELCHI